MSNRPKRQRYQGLKERAQAQVDMKCYNCGGKVRIVERHKWSGPWGSRMYVLPNGKWDRGRVKVHEYMHECQKCGEGFFTGDQVDYSQKQTIDGTLRLYQKRLGYKVAPDIKRQREIVRRKRRSQIAIQASPSKESA